MVGYLVEDNIYKEKLMGLVDRKKSNGIFTGTKLNGPGQGIPTVKVLSPDKVTIKPNTNQNNN